MNKMNNNGQYKPKTNKMLLLALCFISLLIIAVLVLFSLYLANYFSNDTKATLYEPEVVLEEEKVLEMIEEEVQDPIVPEIETQNSIYTENTSRNIDFSIESTYLNEYRNTTTVSGCELVGSHAGLSAADITEAHISQIFPDLAPAELTQMTSDLYRTLENLDLNLHKHCQGDDWQLLTIGKTTSDQLILLQVESSPVNNGLLVLNQYPPIEGVIDFTYDVIDFGDFVGVWHGYGDAGMVTWEVHAIDFETNTLEQYESCRVQAFMDPGQLTCEREYIAP